MPELSVASSSQPPAPQTSDAGPRTPDARRQTLDSSQPPAERRQLTVLNARLRCLLSPRRRGNLYPRGEMIKQPRGFLEGALPCVDEAATCRVITASDHCNAKASGLSIMLTLNSIQVVLRTPARPVSDV